MTLGELELGEIGLGAADKQGLYGTHRHLVMGWLAWRRSERAANQHRASRWWHQGARKASLHSKYPAMISRIWLLETAPQFDCTPELGRGCCAQFGMEA